MSGFLLGAVLFAACTACGYFAGKKYDKSVRFWADFHQFNAYCAIKIPAFCVDIASCVSVIREGEFKQVACALAEGKEPKTLPAHLSIEEKEFVSSYFHKVKTADFRSVSVLFQENREYLLEKEKWARQAYEKNAKACRKLGVLGGVAAFIFVV